MKNEAKAVVDILFKDFNRFTRHTFSGFVAVFLFELGSSNVKTFAKVEFVSKMTLFQGVCYILVAFVVGNLIYLLSRYTICAFVMWGLHKILPSRYGRGLTEKKSKNYFVEIGRFAQYRWSEKFPPKLNEYLIRAWGWVHGMGSVAVVLIVIPGYFWWILKKPPFNGGIGWICVGTGVVLLFFSYLHHICLLLSMEHIAYETQEDEEEKEPVVEGSEKKKEEDPVAGAGE